MVNPGIVDYVNQRHEHQKTESGGVAEGDAEPGDDGPQPVQSQGDLKPDRVCPKMGRTGCCLLGVVGGAAVGVAAGAYIGIIATKAAVQTQSVELLGLKLAAVYTL